MSKMHLFAPFNLEEENAEFTVTITSSLGNSGRFSLTTGSYFTSISCSIEDITYNNLLKSFKDYLFTGGFGTWTYRYDFDTAKYYLNGNVGAIFTFSSFASEVLGMNSGTSSLQTDYVSSFGSKFTWVSTEQEWNNQSWMYENQIIVHEEECDDGRVYAISNEDDLPWLSNVPGNYLCSDWKFFLEEKSNIFSDHSSSLNPNTYEQFLKHVRSIKPFVVFQPPNGQLSASYDDRQGTYKIRAEASKFGAIASMRNFDQYWDINIKTRLLSTGSNFISTSTSFSPVDLENLELWLTSDMGITLSGSDVIAWLDQSGNQRDFIQSTDINRPYYTLSDPMCNGRPTLQFDGIDDKLIHTNSFTPSTTGKATIIANILPISGSSLGCLITQDIMNIDATIGLLNISDSSVFGAFYSNPAATYTSKLITSSAGLMSRVMVTFDTNQSGFDSIPNSYLNNVSNMVDNSNSADISVSISSSQWSIGGDINTALSQSSLIVTDFMVYSRALYPSEISLIDNYLSTKNNGNITDPLPIKENLQIWVDPTAARTTLNGSTLETLGDISGHRKDFIQTISNNQPSYLITDYNFGGYPSITFDGINDILTSPIMNPGTAMTVYLVCFGGTTGKIFETTADSDVQVGIELVSSTQIKAYAKKTTTCSNTVAYSTTVPTILTFTVLPSVANAIQKVYINGIEQAASSGTITTGDLSTNTYNLGSNGSNYFDGTIATLMIYADLHNATNVASMIAWLQRRYNI